MTSPKFNLSEPFSWVVKFYELYCFLQITNMLCLFTVCTGEIADLFLQGIELNSMTRSVLRDDVPHDQLANGMRAHTRTSVLVLFIKPRT